MHGGRSRRQRDHPLHHGHGRQEEQDRHERVPHLTDGKLGPNGRCCTYTGSNVLVFNTYVQTRL